MLRAIGPRPLMITGPIIAAAGLLYLATLTADGNYFVQILPALLVLGVGMACIFVPVQNLALSGVEPHDAGAASATANASMQIGGSIGLSVFTALYVSASESALSADPAAQLEALTAGYSVVFFASAVVMVVAAVVAVVFIRGSKEELAPAEGAAAVHLG
jgi:MFS family permease